MLMSVQVSLSIKDERWEKLLDETDYGHSELRGKIRELADERIDDLLK